jgi:hypothetical protein
VPSAVLLRRCGRWQHLRHYQKSHVYLFSQPILKHHAPPPPPPPPSPRRAYICNRAGNVIATSTRCKQPLTSADRFDRQVIGASHPHAAHTACSLVRLANLLAAASNAETSKVINVRLERVAVAAALRCDIFCCFRVCIRRHYLFCLSRWLRDV